MSRSRFSHRLLILAIIVASVPLMLGFFGAFHPAFDSFAHFRAHLAVLVATMALALFFATRSRLLALSALVFAFTAFSTTSQLLQPLGLRPVEAAFTPMADDRAVYRLLQINLRFDNPTPEKVLSLIGRTQPDVITLDEVSATWLPKLDLLSAAYPHRIMCPYPNGVFGVALLSRRPFTAGSEAHCRDRGALAIASVDLGGTTVDVAAIHLAWPWPFEQAWQIRALAAPLASLGATAIVAGDCNATPWSDAVRRVAKAGGLTLVPSDGPTWLYRKLPDFLRFAGLPIDQVFSKGGIAIHSARRLEDVGSDHLPVMVEFSIRPDASEPDDAIGSAIASGANAGGYPG